MEDGRGNIAKLTPAGMAKLKTPRPAPLASVRGRVFDHVDAATVRKAAQALSQTAEVLPQGR